MTSRLSKFVARLGKCEHGSPATEFALLAPVLLIMTVGVIDYGLVVRAKSEVEAAARAGLQKGFGDMWNHDSITAAAKETLSTDPAIQETATVDVSPSCYCDGTLTASGDDCTKDTTCGGGGTLTHYLTVTVAKTHETLLDYYAFPQELNLTGSATARTR